MILTFVLVLAAIAGAIFYTWPQFNRYTAMRRDTAALERISAELDEAASARDLLAEKIRSVSKADLDRIELALPKTADREGFIRVIEFYGTQSGVQVKTLVLSDESAKETAGQQAISQAVPRPGGVQDASDVRLQKKVSIRIEVTGTYQNVKRFIDSLERHIRVVDVQSLSFSEIASPAQAVNFSITGMTYYQ